MGEHGRPGSCATGPREEKLIFISTPRPEVISIFMVLLQHDFFMWAASTLYCLISVEIDDSNFQPKVTNSMLQIERTAVGDQQGLFL